MDRHATTQWPPLAASWLLEALEADGVTAHCMMGLRLELRIDPHGAVLVDAGTFQAAGWLSAEGGSVTFSDMVLSSAPWGRVPESLEDRAASALTGTFSYAVDGARLTLRNGEAMLCFRPGVARS